MKKYSICHAHELSSLLGLPDSDGIEADLKCSLKMKICKEMKKQNLTPKKVSKLSGVSLSMIEKISECRIQRISLRKLIQITASIGIKAEFKFSKL